MAIIVQFIHFTGDVIATTFIFYGLLYFKNP